MTSRGNLNTLRQLFSWNSTWYNKSFYKQLVFRDLILELYLTSIFYKLRIPSSYFLVKNLYFDFYIIETELYVIKKKSLSSLFLNYTKLSFWIKQLFFFQKKSNNKKQSSFFQTVTSYKLRMEYLFNKLYFFLFKKSIISFLPFTISIVYTRNILEKYSSRLTNNLLVQISKTNKIKKLPNLNSYYFNFIKQYNKSIFYFIYYSESILKDSSFLSSHKLPSRLTIWFSIIQSLRNEKIKDETFLFSYMKINTISPTFFKKKPYSSLIYRYWLMKQFLTFFYKIISFLSDTLKRSSSNFLLLPTSFRKVTIFFIDVINTRLKNLYSIWDKKKSSLLCTIFLKRTLKNRSKKINTLFFYNHYFRVLNTLSTGIEATIQNYTNLSFLFYPTVYITFKPSIKNSKLICDYITMSLENGASINNVWKKIKQWIEDQQSILDRIEGRSLKRRIIGLSRNSLKGIRIICKGPNYKARRKRKFVFHSWVSDDSITGRMPIQSFNTQIDFYQSFAIMKQATIGVRVWTLFEFIKKMS